MLILKKFVAVITLCGFAGDAVFACPPIVRVIKKQQVQVVQQAVAVVNTPIVVTPVATVVTIPTYYTSYDKGYADLAAAVDRLTNKLDGLTKPPTTVDINNGVGVTATPKAQNGLGNLLLQNCAKCHQGDKRAEKSGGGQVLLEDSGEVSILSLAEKKRIVQVINEGSMPPGKPLPENDKKLVTVDGLTTLNATVEKK